MPPRDPNDNDDHDDVEDEEDRDDGEPAVIRRTRRTTNSPFFSGARRPRAFILIRRQPTTPPPQSWRSASPAVARRAGRPPAGKMMFQVLGSFAEYEPDMIRAWVNAGIVRAKAQGRPALKPELAQAIRNALAVPGRPDIRVIAKQFGVSPMTVQNVARA